MVSLSLLVLVGVVLCLSPVLATPTPLSVYAVGVGQGDSNIIQCPNGKDIVIVDMGATRPIYVERSYITAVLKERFQANSSGMNIHVVISHSHVDHYSFIPGVMDQSLVPHIKKVVLGGRLANYSTKFQKWLKSNVTNVYVVNNEKTCYGNKDCIMSPVFSEAEPLSSSYQMEGGVDPWQFCGSSVQFTILGANIGSSQNARSIVMKLVYKNWSLLMSGDFEMSTAQQSLMKKWPNSTFQSLYYKVAHHGAWTDNHPNLPALLQRIRPKKVYISQGYPSLSQYHHPNCQSIQNLQEVGSLVSIDPKMNSPFVCWDSDDKNTIVMQEMSQAIYETCRVYDKSSNKQVCQDIWIKTTGTRDSVQYIDIPSKYVRK